MHMQVILIKRFCIRMRMVLETKDMARTSRLEDTRVNIKSEDGDALFVSSFSNF